MAAREGTISDLVPGLSDDRPAPPPAQITNMGGTEPDEAAPATSEAETAPKKVAKKKAKKKVAKKRAKPSSKSMRICTRCKEEKPAKEFPLVKKTDGPNGRRRSYCDPCWPLYQQEYRERKETGEVKTKKKTKKTKKTKKKVAKKATHKKTKKKVAKKAAPKRAAPKARKVTKKKAKRKTYVWSDIRRGSPDKSNGHLGALVTELKAELADVHAQQSALVKRETAIERRLAKVEKLVHAW